MKQARVPMTVDAKQMCGTPLFAGTKVPIAVLFDYLVEGLKLEDFLRSCPEVKRTEAIRILEHANQLLVHHTP